jgi:hypothetical protein
MSLFQQSPDVPNPNDPGRYAHCQVPPDPPACKPMGREFDADNALVWVIVREFIRVHYPSKLAAVDAAFRDAYDNCLTGEEWRLKYLWIMNLTEPFGMEMEEYMFDVGIFGADAQNCTIDWAGLACTVNWLAQMTPAERAAAVAAMKQGTAAVPVCEATASDPAYPKLPLPMSTMPLPPLPTKKGWTTGQKVALGAGVAVVAVIAGLAGMG